MTPVAFGELAAVATALLWTLSALAWTSAGRQVGALAVSFLRLAVTCVLLALYGWLSRGLWFPSDASLDAWLLLGASGLAGFFVSDLLVFKAFLLIGPRLTLLILSLQPPMAAAMSWAYLGEPLGPWHWLAMLVTLTGVAWVVLERKDGTGQMIAPSQFWRGFWMAVIGAMGQAAGLVLSRKGLGDYDPVAATQIRVLFGLVAFLVLVTLIQRWPGMWTAARHGPAMTVILLGSLVGPCLGVALCMVSLRYCHAGITATIISTTPVLILPFVILVYGEKVSLRATGGAVLSVAGIALLACGG